MAEVVKLDMFTSLEREASLLNLASERVNRSLEEVQKRLIALNLGLEIWHPEPILREAPTGNIGPHDQVTRVMYLLGLAREYKTPSLAIKRVRTVEGFFEGDMNSAYRNEFDDDGDDGPQSLLHASRELRIAALAMVPAFLQTVEQEVKRMRNIVEEAANKANR